MKNNTKVEPVSSGHITKKFLQNIKASGSPNKPVVLKYRDTLTTPLEGTGVKWFDFKHYTSFDFMTVELGGFDFSLVNEQGDAEAFPIQTVACKLYNSGDTTHYGIIFGVSEDTLFGGKKHWEGSVDVTICGWEYIDSLKG